MTAAIDQIMIDEQTCCKRARRAHRTTRICEYGFLTIAAVCITAGLVSQLGIVDVGVAEAVFSESPAQLFLLSSFTALSKLSVPMGVLGIFLGMLTKEWTDMLVERDCERERSAARESRRQQVLDISPGSSELQHLKPDPCDCVTEVVIEVSPGSPLLDVLGMSDMERGDEVVLTPEQLDKLGISVEVAEGPCRCCS